MSRFKEIKINFKSGVLRVALSFDGLELQNSSFFMYSPVSVAGAISNRDLPAQRPVARLPKPTLVREFFALGGASDAFGRVHGVGRNLDRELPLSVTFQNWRRGSFAPDPFDRASAPKSVGRREKPGSQASAESMSPSMRTNR